MPSRHGQIHESTRQITERGLKEVILLEGFLAASLTSVDEMFCELPEDGVYQDEYKSVL
jgi:hypothetical protein